MADTAAFFAKKKKAGKKKTFKAFNANKIDVSAVSTTTHVDAPAISSSADGDLGGVRSSLASTSLSTDAAVAVVGDVGSALDTKGNATKEEQWDDEALAAKLSRTTPVVTATAVKKGKVAELMNMQELESKRREEDDIAERMRVEETKAALAAAKEGMEREAQRLRLENEAKQKAQQDAAIGKPRFGAAAAAVGDSSSSASGTTIGGKWVPPHMRSTGGGGGGGIGGRGLASAFSSSSGGPSSSMMGGSGMGPGSSFQRKVNTQDENMFPDLATADAIVTQQQQQKQAQSAMPRRSKTTNAWGSSAAATKKQPPKKSEPSPPPPAAEADPEPTPPKPATPEPPTKTEAPVVAPASVSKPDVGAGLKKKKKKKKDLSTFKPS
mmetsp:Transcript_27953/g.37313  ORF Transcript_27953/g.37313 Transcript_27953/m.37313 type:complete len:381 (+) Transcript_27953:54-1196(+)